MNYVKHPHQPETIDIKIVDGIFVKSMHFLYAGMFVPQHAHAFEHLSFVASGAVRVEADGVTIGDFAAPVGIVIKARVKHLFTTLAPNTVVLCIHNVANSDGEIAIHEEHHLDFLEGDI